MGAKVFKFLCKHAFTKHFPTLKVWKMLHRIAKFIGPIVDVLNTAPPRIWKFWLAYVCQYIQVLWLRLPLNMWLYMWPPIFECSVCSDLFFSSLQPLSDPGAPHGIREYWRGSGQCRTNYWNYYCLTGCWGQPWGRVIYTLCFHNFYYNFLQHLDLDWVFETKEKD